MTAWPRLIAAVIDFAAYLLPGWALSLCFDLRGWSKIGRVLSWLVLSLLVVPFVLNSLSTVFHIRLTIGTLAALLLAVLGGAVLVRRLAGPIRIDLKDRSGRRGPRGRWATTMIVTLVILFAVLVTVPRAHYLLSTTPSFAGQWDDYWHIARVTALAESGLPPRHPFFPDFPLMYYYAAWIYPALLARGAMALSVHASLAVYGFWVALAYAGAAAALVELNCRTRLGRGLGLALVTFAGGFDLFFSPEMSLAQWWQTLVPGMSSSILIGDSYYNALWVPQHVTALMCFGAVLLLWRNVRGPAPLRAAVLGVAFSVMFASSAFVFLSTMTAVIALVWLTRRRILKAAVAWPRRAAGAAQRWRRGIAPVVLGGGFFAIGSLRVALTTAGGLSVIHWSGFRILLLERILVSHAALGEVFDRILTLIVLPVPIIAILTIELGLAFLLFLAWIWRRPRSVSPVWHRFLALYPTLYLPVVFLLRDDGNNIAARGMMPVALCVAIGGSLLPEALSQHTISRGAKIAFGYLLGVLLLGSMVTPLAEVDYYGRAGIGAALPLPAGLKRLMPPEDPMPEPLRYIVWANQSTPANSLFVEPDALVVDRRYWLLERMRYLGSESVPALRQADPAVDFHLPREALASAAASPQELLEEALASRYVAANQSFVYLIWRQATPPAVQGEVAYQDATVIIYRLRGGLPVG